MIKQTAEIFEILSKGGFISSDSTNPNIRQLYTVIEDNQSELYDFFAAINFVLESGNEYYYFSRRENKVDLERKLEIVHDTLHLQMPSQHLHNAYSLKEYS